MLKASLAKTAVVAWGLPSVTPMGVWLLLMPKYWRMSCSMVGEGKDWARTWRVEIPTVKINAIVRMLLRVNI